MKKQTFTVTGTIWITEKMKNSTMGNPRYQFVIVDDVTGEITSLYTGVNSSYGYSIKNYHGKRVTVEYSIVRNKPTLQSLK